MKRGGYLERRTRLKPMSDKTRARIPARQACVAAVIARDKVCQVWAKAKEVGMYVPPCSGHLTAHEPAHRRNSDPTNPDDCVAACVFHNGWVEDHPNCGYRLGLLVRGNGRPLR